MIHDRLLDGDRFGQGIQRLFSPLENAMKFG